MKRILYILVFTIFANTSFAAYILIPMDVKQSNHLKAYGIAYWILKNDISVDWLLNYRGGSFMFKHGKILENECLIRGVSYEIIADVQSSQILQQIANPEANMDVARLDKAPEIAVYSPKEKLPWDDAVTLALTYAEVPYKVIYDEEILRGDLHLYDWLHLHHEDFTGQYGKFYRSYQNAGWYIEQKRNSETTANRLGFDKVSKLKLAVAQNIQKFVAGGGYMFAMCAATDSYDIALSAHNTDICESMFDGDGSEPNYQQKLDFNKTFAFTDFHITRDPNEYEFSDIDVTQTRRVDEKLDQFTLFDFSAKWDQVPTMLCQNHTAIIPGFMGQTTAFNKKTLKSSVLVLGENKSANEAKYIHGKFGNGTWTFYGGHDPEDYSHRVGDPPTDLSLHPNSPGYRLILNNVLFPAAKKKKQKT